MTCVKGYSKDTHLKNDTCFMFWLDVDDFSKKLGYVTLIKKYSKTILC